MPPLPPLTQALMLACTGVFCLQFFTPLPAHLALFPIGSGNFRPWQLLTYAFTHLDFLSLTFGMLGLWMFGGEMELSWGRKHYAAFLAVGVAFGAFTFLVLSLFFGGFLLAGSYAAMYALLIAAAMAYPHRVITPLIPPIPMKMKTFVTVFGVIALLMAFSAGVGALAHLGGAIGGFLTMRYWQKKAPFGWRRR